MAWSVSESPNMAQQLEMLDMMLAAMPEGARPVLHSGMGWQYQNERNTRRRQVKLKGLTPEEYRNQSLAT